MDNLVDWAWIALVLIHLSVASAGDSKFAMLGSSIIVILLIIVGGYIVIRACYRAWKEFNKE